MAKEISEEFKFLGKSLYFPAERTLVIADLHIGYEEYLNSQGVLIPRSQLKEIMQELEKIFEEIRRIKKDKIEEAIVLGDLKHEFGTISEQEWKEVHVVLDFLKSKSKKVILVKGNHDTLLGPIAKRREITIKEYYVKEGTCFLHGNKLFSECLDRKIKMLVLGHRHPAIILADKYKKEKYKCFLVGEWKRKKVIILPSFFPFIEGSDIVSDYEENKLFIPEKILKDFDVFVVGDEVYRFGKLKKII